MTAWRHILFLTFISIAVCARLVTGQVTIGFTQTQIPVNESDGNAVVCVNITEGTLDPGEVVVVMVSTMDNTTVSVGNETDYMVTMEELTFNYIEAGSAVGPLTPMFFDIYVMCVNVPIKNDTLSEDKEDFMVMLMEVGMTENVTIDPMFTTVTITDDDMVVIGVIGDERRVAEGDSVMVCVNLTMGTLRRDVEVSISSQDITATADSDYMAVKEVVFFSSTVTQNCVSISTLMDNMTAENSENFAVNITSNNSLVTLSPASVIITIVDAPNIIQPPEDLFVLFGDTAVFYVTANGLELSYQWSMNGMNLTDSDRIMGSSDSVLTISNVTRADLGSYTCVISNFASSVSTTAELSLLDPPSFVNPRGDLGVLTGDEVTLYCMATSQDGNVTVTLSAESTNLTLPEPVVEQDGNLANSSITFTAMLEYNGTYVCTAMNRAGTVSINFTLSVITIVGVDSVVAVVGSNTSLFCNATGNPNLKYEWRTTIDGKPLNYRFDNVTGPRVSGDRTNTLVITNVSRRDDAEYSCVVSLFGGVVGNASGNLTTLGPMIIEDPQDDTLTAPNDTLILNCTATNPPTAPNPLTFLWFFNSLPLNASTRVIITSPMIDNNAFTSQLIIERVNRNDSGPYHCAVHNRAVEDLVMSQIADITIEFAPVVSIGVYIDEGVKYQVARVNANVVTYLVCIVESEPPPDLIEIVFIVMNGSSRTVLANNTSPVEGQLTLRSNFTPSLEDNKTVYECLAENDVGTGLDQITIIVQDVPGPIDHSEITFEVIDLLRVSLSWPLPTDNNSPITAYNFFYCVTHKSGILVDRCKLRINENRTITNFTVTNGLVQAVEMFPVDTTINLTITAVNGVGRGRALNEPRFINTATRMDAMPVNITTVVLTSNAVVLSWERPSLTVGDDIMFGHYNVTFTPRGDSEGVCTVMVTGTGVSRSDLRRMAVYYVSVLAVFTKPDLISLPATFNFTAPNETEVETLLDQRVAIAPVNEEDFTTTVSWPIPPNTEFLTGFVIQINSTSLLDSRRRRRQSSPREIPVGPGVTSADVSLPPYSNNTLSVFAEFNPDPGPDSEPIRVLVVEPDSTITVEGRAGAPTIVNIEPVEFTKLRITWTPPAVPNGVISDHEVEYITGIVTRTVRTTSRDVVFLLTGLMGGVEYRIRVLAVTNSGQNRGNYSQQITNRTNIGASPPTLTASRSSFDDEVFSLEISLKDVFGPISHYQIIVSTSRRSNSRQDVPHPFTATTGDPYIASQGDYTTSTRSFFLGSGTGGQHRGMTFQNPRLEADTDYFVFVRVVSALNGNVFNDSAVRGPLRFSSPLNPFIIIGPIAAIALVLLFVLIVLLVVAYFTMQGPQRRHYLPQDGLLEDGKRKNKGGAAIELRRTRLFSPVLNVGDPDVFTSADQPTTLICEASGTPAPEVTWTHNDQPLDKERFIQLADGSLFINDTDLQDEGTYVVRASNSAGEAEAAVRMTVLRPVPPEPDAEHTAIKVGEFSQKIALVRAEDDEGLEDEYAEVELDWTFTSYSAKLNINKNKNRYINIIPYDHARVVLSLQDNTPGSDYINASFIDAYQRPNGYIASQGPIPSTFPDFWRMIWELDSPTIVMVTNLKEEDKIKCHQYWPSYGTTTYGNIQVTLKEVENLAEYSIRTFNVSPLAGQSRVPMPVREVRQFHFLVWPDHGVPQYATNLLSFRKRVLKYHPEKRGPMVVHCSAGVGRTGTFITIDYMLKQMETEGTIDIFNYVRHMRYRRNYMVQTSPQYVFIHDALLESIMCGDNSIKAPELREKVKELQLAVPETGKTTFQTQFDTLMTASPPDDDFDCSIAQLPDNMSKNRSKEHLPANDYRVVLSTDDNQSDYICASYVDNYRERNAFIVTQAPMENTTGDFWRMIWETKSAAIVMLTELVEGDKEMCVKYWPSGVSDPGVFGGYQVELSEDEKDRGSYITRRFKLSPLDKPQESRMVSQFHFTTWTKTTPPTDCRPMVDLIDELQRVQRKSGNMPITVHCDDGISRTGAFCSLYSVLERVKTEQIVDVFQAVKTLRIQRAGLLGTIDEYEFVHRVVIEFLDTFSDYQNFK